MKYLPKVPDDAYVKVETTKILKQHKAYMAQFEEMLNDEKKSHNDRHLYDELISYADLYDSASFEAKKMIVNQLIRRVDVYRGYQINISFKFDLTPYIEGSDASTCKTVGHRTSIFKKQRNSKNWGLPSMRLQNQAFG